MIHDLNHPDTNGDGTANNTIGNNIGVHSQDLDERPMRYRHLVLADDWYKSGRSKRKHRKSNLPFGFKELNDIIAKRWESVDEETKEYLKNISAVEWKVYKAEKEKYDEEMIRAAADNRINAQYSAHSQMMVQSQDQGKFFRVCKMHDSSQNEAQMRSMQPIQQNTDLVQQENNDMSPNMPTTVMPNMSGLVCQSRPFSLPASHEYE